MPANQYPEPSSSSNPAIFLSLLEQCLIEGGESQVAVVNNAITLYRDLGFAAPKTTSLRTRAQEHITRLVYGDGWTACRSYRVLPPSAE